MVHCYTGTLGDDVRLGFRAVFRFELRQAGIARLSVDIPNLKTTFVKNIFLEFR